MCRSLTEGGRRCACNEQTKALANHNRAVARAKRRTISTRAAAFGGAALGEAVSALPPSRLTAFLIAADQVRPGTLDEMAGDIGTLPGIHNMVTEDRRDTTSAFGKANNSGKLDPHAIARVQQAVLEFDKARLDDGEDLSGSARAKLQRSIDVREAAIGLGLLNGETVTLKRYEDMTPDQKGFYASIAPEDLPALVDVQQRVSRSFWDRHLNEAEFGTEERKPTQGLSLYSENGVPKTLGGLLAEHPGSAIKLSDDLILTRDANGNVVLDDLHNKTRVTAQPYMSARDALARLPRVTTVGLPQNASSAAQRLVDAKFLDEDTAVGANHVKTLRSAAAQAMFASGVPVNRGEDGKASWQRHRFLAEAGLARPVIREMTPRTEGYELNGHARVAMQAKEDEFKAAAAGLGIELPTSEKTLHGSKRSVPDARYRGPVKNISAVKAGGFWPRSNAGTAPPEAAAAFTLPDSVFDPKVTNADKADHYTVADANLGRGLAARVGEANRILRNGANPETAGDAAHVSAAALHGAFTTRQAVKPHRPTVINAVASVPSGWREEDGDFFKKVFGSGYRVDTQGYVAGAVAGTDADAGSRALGPRQYKVQYLSTGHLTDADGSAVINTRTGFRVHSVDHTGDVPLVRLVQDDLAADVAAGNVTL